MDTPRQGQADAGSVSSEGITRGTARDTGRENDGGAPRYVIPPRELTAVEIPAVVEDIDRAVRAFGRAPSLRHVSCCSIARVCCVSPKCSYSLLMVMPS